MPVFSVHVPKTGGTSFLQVLSWKYQSAFVLDYDADQNAILRQLASGAATCVHGHYRADKYAACDGQFITWARNPLDRLVSHYNFWKLNRYPDSPEWRRFHFEDWDFMRFALSPSLQNQQHAYIGSIPFERYSVIGITEFYDESMEVFRRELDLHHFPAPLLNKATPRENALDPSTLSRQDMALIMEFHSADFVLYTKALARFRELSSRNKGTSLQSANAKSIAWGPSVDSEASGLAAMSGRAIVGKRIKDAGIRHIRGSYYYGDAWPINAWDSFRREVVDSFISCIKNNGYNTVILLIPAGLTRVRRDNPEYFEAFMSDFMLLLEKIRAAGLCYCLRLAYAWDGYPTEGHRGRHVFSQLAGGQARAELKSLVEGIWSRVADDPHFLFGFITWEDMLMFPINTAPSLDPAERKRFAEELDYEGCPDGVPTMQEQDSERYLHFLDHKFSDLFYDLKTVFPALTAEVRVDITPFTGADGSTQHFHHIRQMAEIDSDVIGTYFGTYMIQQQDSPTAEQGMAAMNLAHRQVRTIAPSKKLFVDQLNFVIQEKAFAHYPIMSAFEESRFMKLLVVWFDDTTVGYATWSFVDYLTDIISNSAFRLGLDSWTVEGDAQLVVAGEQRYLPLQTGQSIHADRIRHYSGWVRDGWVHIEGDLEQDTVLRVELSDEIAIELTDADFEAWPFGVGRHLLRHFIGKSTRLKLSVLKGALNLRRLSMGHEICGNGGCTVSMRSTESSDRIATFNRELAQKV